MVQLAVCDRELIENCLAEAGVCPRCCLRFTGEKYAPIYRKLSGDVEATKKVRPNCCVACLGALQDEWMVPLLSEVAETINNCGYDADTFSLTLSIPMCISLRQHSLLVHLRQKLPPSIVEGLSIEKVVSIKQIWKYIYPQLVAEKVHIEHSAEDPGFSAEIQADWIQESQELECMSLLCPQEYATRAQNIHVYNMGVFSRMGVEKSLSCVDDQHFSLHYPVPPSIPITSITVSTKMIRSSLFIGGRYCKYSRDLPQTPWLINNVRKCETSVEELLASCIADAVQASELKFLASGREDVDVRMLGTGRPFAIECCNPKRAVFSASQLQQLGVEFNKHNIDISVHDLSLVTKDNIKKLKEGEEEKRKRYTALCVTASPVDQEKFRALEQINDLKVEQQTPIRVLHRRANSTRSKIIHKMSFSFDNLAKNMFKIDVITSAGTYVKEFVHGDFSRTVPSLKTLLEVDTDILALDVMEVMLPWPPNSRE